MHLQVVNNFLVMMMFMYLNDADDVCYFFKAKHFKFMNEIKKTPICGGDTKEIVPKLLCYIRFKNCTNILLFY
jgi:hypothetical protein